ncbi:hypothetical protein ABPG77_010559 [Micractinium sp. CCAP 211/92]
MTDTNPYKAEYAKSGRATCTGPCKRLIAKGELRLGSPLMFGEGVTYKWRHWGCITKQVLNNMRGKIERHGADVALLGRDALRPEDQERVQRWLDEGPFEEEREQGEQAESSEEHEAEEEQEEEEEPAPPVKTPRKRATAPARASKRAAAKRLEGGDNEEDEDYEPKPAKRKVTKRTRK